MTIRATNIVLVLSVWLSLIIGGFVALNRYDSAPGDQGRALSSWPSTSKVPAPNRRPLLIVFAHPQCPCTRATLGELDQIEASAATGFDVDVLFERPSSEPAGWERSALWRSAASMRRLHVIVDNDGVEAHRFGARTSGQAFLYSSSGQLMFRGGITAGRGHMGDSAGKSAILDILAGRKNVLVTTPVFGCALTNDAFHIKQEIGN